MDTRHHEWAISDLSELDCYFVLEYRGGWKVEFCDDDFGREFTSLKRAIHVAHEAAEARSLLTGSSTCVRVGACRESSNLEALFGSRLPHP